MTTSDSNPLLITTGMPAFDRIDPSHVAPAITHLIRLNEDVVDALCRGDETPTWENFVEPLHRAGEQLSYAWGIVGHLHSVLDVPPWREAYNAMLPQVSRFYAAVGQNLGLFQKYLLIRESVAFESFSPTRQRIVEFALRNFRLGGAALPESQKPRFKAIQESLSSLSAKFSENLLDATNAFAEYVEDEALLVGLPEDVKQAARTAAEQEGRTGWRFSLQMPSYLPVMQYADNRALREKLYRANATRASEFGPPEWNNGPLMCELLALRQEDAQMLGFQSFAEESIYTKMAESPEQVLDFLRDLGARAKPFAEKDLAELRTFAQSTLGLSELAPWDVTWASEKLRQARYAFSENEVRQYLPEPKVLAGLFGVIQTLYGVQIHQDKAPVWHPDVRFFRIEKQGVVLGHFYLDLYARDSKRGGAWMGAIRSRLRTAAGLTTPIAYLVCNFSQPVGTSPATFTHDEVLTLFHEFGHGLHHLLTHVEECALSGIDGVEWDAVELPSQFMENFCWEWDVLEPMTAHIETGQPLPRALFDKMIAAKNFQSGLQTVRQLEFSLFDMLLHRAQGDALPKSPEDVQALLSQVREEIAVIHPPAWHRFANSFSHIFAGGYAAGYYSYKWAEVLSADAFEAFEEARQDRGSLLNPLVGERFWREVLSVGGSRPALVSFEAFRGRAPRIDALLRHSGMVN